MALSRTPFFYQVFFFLLLCAPQLLVACSVAVLKETASSKRLTKKMVANGQKKDRCILTQQSYFTQEIQKALLRLEQELFEEICKEDPKKASEISYDQRRLLLEGFNKSIGTNQNKKMLARFVRHASPDAVLGLVQVNPTVACLSAFYERVFDASPELLSRFLSKPENRLYVAEFVNRANQGQFISTIMGNRILQECHQVQERLLRETGLADFIDDPRNKACVESIYAKDVRFKEVLDKVADENREMEKLAQKSHAELARCILHSNDLLKDLFCRKARIEDLYGVAMIDRSFLERPTVIKRIAASYLVGEFLYDERNCNYVIKMLAQLSQDQLWYAIQDNENLFAPLIRERYGELKKAFAYDCLELNEIARPIDNIDDLIGVYPYLRKSSPEVHSRILQIIEISLQEDIDRLASHLTFEHHGLFCKQIEKKLQSLVLREKHAHRLRTQSKSELFKTVVDLQLQKDTDAVVKMLLEVSVNKSEEQAVCAKSGQKKDEGIQSWRSSNQRFSVSSPGRELSKAFEKMISCFAKPAHSIEPSFIENIIANPWVRVGFGSLFGWPAAGAFVINDMLIMYSRSLCSHCQEGQDFSSSYLLSMVVSIIGRGVLKGASAILVSCGEEMVPAIAAIKLTTSAHQGLQIFRHVQSITDRVSDAMCKNDLADGALALSELGLYRNYLNASADSVDAGARNTTSKVQVVAIFEELDSADEELLKQLAPRRGLRVLPLPSGKGISVEAEIALDTPVASLDAAEELLSSRAQDRYLKMELGLAGVKNRITPTETRVAVIPASGQGVVHASQFPWIKCSKTAPPEDPHEEKITYVYVDLRRNNLGDGPSVIESPVPLDPQSFTSSSRSENFSLQNQDGILPYTQPRPLELYYSSEEYRPPVRSGDSFLLTNAQGVDRNGGHRVTVGGPRATSPQYVQTDRRNAFAFSNSDLNRRMEAYSSAKNHEQRLALSSDMLSSIANDTGSLFNNMEATRADMQNFIAFVGAREFIELACKIDSHVGFIKGLQSEELLQQFSDKVIAVNESIEQQTLEFTCLVDEIKQARAIRDRIEKDIVLKKSEKKSLIAQAPQIRKNCRLANDFGAKACALIMRLEAAETREISERLLIALREKGSSEAEKAEICRRFYAGYVAERIHSSYFKEVCSGEFANTFKQLEDECCTFVSGMALKDFNHLMSTEFSVGPNLYRIFNEKVGDGVATFIHWKSVGRIHDTASKIAILRGITGIAKSNCGNNLIKPHLAQNMTHIFNLLEEGEVSQAQGILNTTNSAIDVVKEFEHETARLLSSCARSAETSQCDNPAAAKEVQSTFEKLSHKIGNIKIDTFSWFLPVEINNFRNGVRSEIVNLVNQTGRGLWALGGEISQVAKDILCDMADPYVAESFLKAKSFDSFVKACQEVGLEKSGLFPEVRVAKFVGKLAGAMLTGVVTDIQELPGDVQKFLSTESGEQAGEMAVRIGAKASCLVPLLNAFKSFTLSHASRLLPSTNAAGYIHLMNGEVVRELNGRALAQIAGRTTPQEFLAKYGSETLKHLPEAQQAMYITSMENFWTIPGFATHGDAPLIRTIYRPGWDPKPFKKSLQGAMYEIEAAHHLRVSGVQVTEFGKDCVWNGERFSFDLVAGKLHGECKHVTDWRRFIENELGTVKMQSEFCRGNGYDYIFMSKTNIPDFVKTELSKEGIAFIEDCCEFYIKK